jgi:hypothetical protein
MNDYLFLPLRHSTLNYVVTLRGCDFAEWSDKTAFTYRAGQC